MVFLADDEDVEAEAVEFEGGVVGFADEGAGGVDEGFSCREEAGALAVACAVGGDEDLRGGGDIVVGFGGEGKAAGGEFGVDEGVVDELAADGDLGGVGEGTGEGEGVADAEAEAEMLGGEDFHAWPFTKYFVLQSLLR